MELTSAAAWLHTAPGPQQRGQVVAGRMVLWGQTLGFRAGVVPLAGVAGQLGWLVAALLWCDQSLRL